MPPPTHTTRVTPQSVVTASRDVQTQDTLTTPQKQVTSGPAQAAQCSTTSSSAQTASTDIPTVHVSSMAHQQVTSGCAQEAECGTTSPAAPIPVATVGPSQQQGAVGGVSVGSGVDKEIQTEPTYRGPKDLTSSDDPELAVKEEYRTSAKRAR